ncbi:uncharacterized protein LOC143267368 isoform X1 [Peromyscus maniculatus bairdii]|uniref:uncharacterized protein LOC143267368 isoform X1 n=1 Tax=Peromyscus maniculatus bairdii TaxID=230844 RepID=UPI003FD51FA2
MLHKATASPDHPFGAQGRDSIDRGHVGLWKHNAPAHPLETVQKEQTPLHVEDGGKLVVRFLCVLQSPFFISCLAAILLLMQLLSADLLDSPRKGVGAPAADGWNSDQKD